MNNNIIEIQKDIEEFQTKFLEVKKMQELMLNYINSIQTQKDLIEKKYSENCSEIQKLILLTESNSEKIIDEQINRIDITFNEKHKELKELLLKYVTEISETNKLYLEEIDDISNRIEKVTSKIEKIERKQKNFDNIHIFLTLNIILLILVFISTIIF